MRTVVHREKRTEKPPFRERLSRLLGIPSDAIGADGFMAEWRGRGSVTVRGCRKILSYEMTEIRLRTRDGDVTVTGNGLTCFSYFYGAIGIEGRIDSVSLCGASDGVGRSDA